MPRVLSLVWSELHSRNTTEALISLDRFIEHNFQTHPEDIPRIPWVNNPIIKKISRRKISPRIMNHTLPECFLLFRQGSLIQLLPGTTTALTSNVSTTMKEIRREKEPYSGFSCDGAHNTTQLIRTHNTTTSNGPRKEKSRIIRPSAHSIIPRSITCPTNNANLWHLLVCISIIYLRRGTWRPVCVCVCWGGLKP